MKLLVTGGAGFYCSAVVRHFAGRSSVEVVNVDALTYAGNLDSLNSIAEAPNYNFIKADICDQPLIARILREYRQRSKSVRVSRSLRRKRSLGGRNGSTMASLRV